MKKDTLIILIIAVVVITLLMAHEYTHDTGNYTSKEMLEEVAIVAPISIAILFAPIFLPYRLLKRK